METKSIFDQADQNRIVAAIHEAELQTSGEVRVHIEARCPTKNAVERAQEVFFELGLHKTALQNGVLFYLATDDRKFAVVGDRGIDQKVPAGFWDGVKNSLRAHFSAGRFTDGFCAGIELAGHELKTYFPRQADDKNELPDDISFG